MFENDTGFSVNAKPSELNREAVGIYWMVWTFNKPGMRHRPKKRQVYSLCYPIILDANNNPSGIHYTVGEVRATNDSRWRWTKRYHMKEGWPNKIKDHSEQGVCLSLSEAIEKIEKEFIH